MRVAHVVLGLILPGCFIGYDSRWGQQKQAQQHFAAAETPKALEAAPRADNRPRAVRKMRLRLRATPAYVAQVVDWQRRFEETLATTNGVLEPTVGVRLEVASSEPWNPAHGEDSIAQLLEALRQADPGDDVDWVVGLAGAVPRFEESFHELGIGQVPGKHLVVRSINHAAEYQAFEQGLNELSADDRAKLRQARLSHKASTVLLHELGHTLGALHEQDATSIMGPRYSKNVTHFDPATLDVMRLVLEHRAPNGMLDEAGRRAVAERLQREPAPWIASEREQELERLLGPRAHPSSTPAAASKTTSGAPSGPTPQGSTNTTAPAPVGLSATEERAFTEARRKLEAGDARGALTLAQPLFSTHPSDPGVQTLRCDIAMRRGGSWGEIRQECAGAMQGTPGLH
jgi:hypothetical protein